MRGILFGQAKKRNFAPEFLRSCKKTMKAAMIRQRLKPWMLPIAMVGGLVFHDWIGHVTFLTPYLIFLMLLITFCRVNPREIRMSPLIAYLLAVQVLGGIALYYAIRPLSLDVAQGTFICVFCPTATAAPVVTGMLGGNVGRLVTYSLVSNVVVAVTAPLLLSTFGSADIPLLESTRLITVQVAPLILGPLVVALAMRKATPKLYHGLGSHQAVSFYVWAVSLFIVVGKSVSFIMQEPAEKMLEIIVIALAAGVVCGLQFIYGRKIGRRFGDPISGAQGLGQKNTVLAIWLALTYLNPISSVGPAAYIAWQNTINSVQLYYHQKKLDGGEKQ